MLDEMLVPLPDVGRVFRSGRRVRLADADVTGRLRLDACARYVQDAGNDDTAESGIEDPRTTWVARRAVIDVHRPPRWREWVDLATWCGGTGSRWAERRLSLTGDRGGRVEIATLWVHVDVATMTPARLPDAFVTTYAEAALGRRVSSKRWLDGPPADAASRSWPLRAVDVDLLGHVNNAAYWAAVEEHLLGGSGGGADEGREGSGGSDGGPAAPRHPVLAAPHRAVIEHGSAVDPGAEVELRVTSDPSRVSVWFTVAGTVHAATTVVAMPDGAGG